MLNVEPVGSYAFRVEWNDGHNTGIYSYDHLAQYLPVRGVQAETGVAHSSGLPRGLRLLHSEAEALRAPCTADPALCFTLALAASNARRRRSRKRSRSIRTWFCRILAAGAQATIMACEMVRFISALARCPWSRARHSAASAMP